MATFLIGGYFGAGNLGDEAILECMLNEFRLIDQSTHFIVTSWDPESTSARYQVEAFHWKDFGSLFSKIQTADLVILGGGGLLQDYWGINPSTYLTREYWGLTAYGSLPLLAKLFNIPAMSFALGLGPFSSEQGLQHTRFILENCDVVTLRDEDSYITLKKSGFSPKIPVKVFADPAAALKSTPDQVNTIEKLFSTFSAQEGGHYLGINLRDWDLAGPQTEWIEKVSEGINQFLDEHEQYQVVTVPFQKSGESQGTKDAKVLAEFSARIKKPERVILCGEQYSAGEVQALIERCDLFLSMRLHGLILAANSGTPMVALAYDPKVTNFMNSIGAGNYCCQLKNLRSFDLNQSLKNALEHRSQIQEKCVRIHQTSIQKVKANAALAFELAQLHKEKNISIPQQITLDQTLRIFNQSQEIETQKEALQAGLLIQENLAQQNALLSEERNSLQNNLAESQNSLAASLIKNQKLQNQHLSEKARILVLQQELAELKKSHAELSESKQSILSENSLLHDQVQIGRLELSSIYDGKAWKFVSAYYKLMDKQPFRTLRKIISGKVNPQKYLRLPEQKLIEIKKKIYEPPPFFKDTFEFESFSPVEKYSSTPGSKKQQGVGSKNGGSFQKAYQHKVSLISSVKNESGNIEGWFERILNQTRPPDEIILVDNGSTDGTLVQLKTTAQKSKIPIRVLSEPRGNIAHNRNLAIKLAQYPIIAATDFGCLARLDWLEKITLPFEKDPDIQVSAGIYEPATEKQGQLLRNKNLWLWSNPENIDPQSYLPPGGSIAFRKEIWEKVGGFPEWLTLTGEDTYFDLALKFFGGKWAFMPEAIVEWMAPTTLPDYLKKMYRWAIGDGESGIHARYYWRYLPRLLYWTIFSILTLTALILVSVFTHSIFWITGIILVYLLLNIFIASKLNLTFRLIPQRVLGEFFQLAGFIKGAKNRKIVDARRFTSSNGVIFLLSGVPLDDTGGGSRGAQITQELLRKGYIVVYINRFPKNENRDLNIRFVHPNLFCYALKDFDWKAFEKEHQEIVHHRNLSAVLEFPLPEFLPLIDQVKKLNGKVLYDLIDDWQSTLGWTWYSADIEKKVIEASDVLTATVPSLQERQHRVSGQPVGLLPNAVNGHLFNPKNHYSRPVDLPPGKRIILYIGALWGDWFDWDLLGKIAYAYPQDCVCLIGDYREQTSKAFPNLLFLGLKAQSDLPAYLAYADVTFIPWKVNPITQATSPLKLYEYLAMHCPVVTPNLRPLKSIPGLWLAKNESDFVELIGKVNRSSLNLDQVDSFIEKNNWSTRVDALLTLLKMSATDQESR